MHWVRSARSRVPLRTSARWCSGQGGSRGQSFMDSESGALVTVASRTEHGAKSWPSSSTAKRSIGIAVNAYSAMCDQLHAGRHAPQRRRVAVSKTFLKPSMLVFDTVYNPESTLLIKDGRSTELPVVTGVEMFIRQAMLQFYLVYSSGG